MNKLIGVLAVALTLCTAAAVAIAGPLPGTGVKNSPHDINKKIAGADTLQRTCIFCHTPHNAVSVGGGTVSPLWNRTDVIPGGYIPYAWAAPLNLEIGPILNTDALIGPTRLCMSCHDGSINMDEHGGALAQAGATLMSGSKMLGTDLTNTHPIGFSYDVAVDKRNIVGPGATTELVDKAEHFATLITDSATIGTYDTVTRGGKRRIQDVLYSGSVVTCASCHEVHNKDNVAPTKAVGTDPQRNYFLWADEKDSLICLSCHLK